MGNKHSVRLKHSDVRETYSKKRFRALNESLSKSQNDVSSCAVRKVDEDSSHEELIKDSQEIVVERNGARGNMAGRYERSSSHYDDVDFRARRENPAKYRFQFENLVFEGGGNKGLAYCGAVKVSLLRYSLR